ncbi:anthranilate synthase alpha subunit 2, chloroplastic-like [Quercus lobata]|uniref:anthranilate synthase alpha subunit 2, chloroplastic-like n=1 Tax=Quercus lobata TaxID=97700 RepID=UPI0012458982|nr:anthranilate synthase alpha subunit 2, chloroplastic-like [Quercus lobata]
MEIVAKENMVTIMDHEERSLTKELVEDPMVITRRISKGWKPQLIDKLPCTFCDHCLVDLLHGWQDGRLPYNLWMGVPSVQQSPALQKSSAASP